jgi:prophage regulatory protein
MQIYLSDVQLAERYGVARPTIWRWSAAGSIPSPVQLSPGCTRWLKEEVEACDAQRQRARRSHAKSHPSLPSVAGLPISGGLPEVRADKRTPRGIRGRVERYNNDIKARENVADSPHGASHTDRSVPSLKVKS